METQTTDTKLATYKVDPAHSEVGFRVRHLGFSRVRGRFDDFEATLQFDPTRLASLQVETIIDVASIETDDEKRNAHLRSEDFFEAEKYPKITFESTSVQNVSVDRLELTGNLTMHGVTRPVVLETTYLGAAKDPWGGSRVGFEARTKVNRKDFGLNWNAVLETGGMLVSEEVEILLDIQAVQEEG